MPHRQSPPSFQVCSRFCSSAIVSILVALTVTTRPRVAARAFAGTSTRYHRSTNPLSPISSAKQGSKRLFRFLSSSAVPRRRVSTNYGAGLAFFSSSSSSMQDSTTAFSMAKKRLESPSAERNKDPIWRVLSTQIIPRLEESPKPWRILEAAAGAGVHTEHFASRLRDQTRKGPDPGTTSTPPFVWHPTDPDTFALASVASRVRDRGLGAFVADPQQLTLGASGPMEDGAISTSEPLDLVLCINMIHISPWEATLGLMKVAGKRLRKPTDASEYNGGYLYTYGPYFQDGITVPSNEAFDQSLKSVDPDWGVRNLKDVVAAAEAEGLELVEVIDMPANNNSLIFRRKTK